MIRISDNRRFLINDDGSPFFYLADTAWELFHRLTREDARFYLRDRAAKGFNVIQAVLLAEFNGLTLPNAYGHLPLENGDPARPIDAYFQHVDWIVDQAAALGLYIGMLPTWGDKWNKKWGTGPEIFTPDNARVYGRYVGRRYRDKPIIWIMGGDRHVETEPHLAILIAMAQGIRDAGADQLMTLHPHGGHGSSESVHQQPWLDFNMWQSGHARRYNPNWRMIDGDYQLMPTKPTLDGEPWYENHPVAHGKQSIWCDEHDVRCLAYWAVFHGACGHTYGCHDMWGFTEPGWQPVATVRGHWFDSIHLPGARQVGYLKNLMLSRPYLTRIPDQSILIGDAGCESDHRAATRDGTVGQKDATYVMAYCPTPAAQALDTSVIAGAKLRVWSFNPRSSHARREREIDNAGRFHTDRSQVGPDRVIVIDDAARDYPPPGS
ncbi:MAG: DUF4038 domain-containing protein [Phycisphaeraceae bacterium]